VLQEYKQCPNRLGGAALWALALVICQSLAWAAPCAADLKPQLPAAFLPGGMIGMQPGGLWRAAKSNPALHEFNCQSVADAGDFDEVCFFKVAGASRVAGALIHDGFIVRKDDRVVLVGTGIAIDNADDPLAESVIESFQSQTHLAFQHNGDNVLFVKMPARNMSSAELLGFSKQAPVLLVQLESAAHELAVFYGYLAPVNAFGALTAN
jgi:hypothetical protein